LPLPSPGRRLRQAAGVLNVPAAVLAVGDHLYRWAMLIGELAERAGTGSRS
jgi:hypothetical protein